MTLGFIKIVLVEADFGLKYKFCIHYRIAVSRESTERLTFK